MSAVDMKALFKDLRFADSKDSIGLQLADIVASTFHRACKGTLQKDGWKPLGALLVSRKKSVVNLIAISADPNVLEKQISSNAHLTDVLFSLKKEARPMIAA